MEIPDSLIDYVKEESRKLKHGRIIININESNKHIDITTEKAVRFYPEKNENYHNG
jgi:GTP:adenosylcobinamide-phosphate guanylyltransferase